MLGEDVIERQVNLSTLIARREREARDSVLAAQDVDFLLEILEEGAFFEQEGFQLRMNIESELVKRNVDLP